MPRIRVSPGEEKRGREVQALVEHFPIVRQQLLSRTSVLADAGEGKGGMLSLLYPKGALIPLESSSAAPHNPCTG